MLLNKRQNYCRKQSCTFLWLTVYSRAQPVNSLHSSLLQQYLQAILAHSKIVALKLCMKTFPFFEYDVTYFL